MSCGYSCLYIFLLTQFSTSHYILFQTFAAVAVCLAAAAYGYPSGAPEPACSSLAPIHLNTTLNPHPLRTPLM
ncbi:hypothetical protein EB796_012321 [Bugula neritina]|uniref:Uncharacterized protein n=1 Tax=Bugula neritina TaxID=10212 RepID=A0A7J7JVL6_BUGNE|nr:hypothetical protein EB796_012321 [Bugula neritina]